MKYNQMTLGGIFLWNTVVSENICDINSKIRNIQRIVEGFNTIEPYA